MIDVLVTCYPHTGKVSTFPQVRGHYLAQQLARSGLAAEFCQLPVPSFECKVLICSEYQQTMEWFDRHLAGPLSDMRADRLFCMSEHSLFGREDHFSSSYCDWFRDRGGVLVHRPNPQLLEGEHWIGVGVDPDVVQFAENGVRNRVVFDFPKSQRRDTATDFELTLLTELRKRLPGLHFVGTGPPESGIREKFDDWIPYGQDHQSYVNQAFAGSLAVIPGWHESMGLAMAEAQVAGACIVSAGYGMHADMVVPEAAISCNRDIQSLAAALSEASIRDPRRIRESAIEKFDFAAVVARTRAAIGL